MGESREPMRHSVFLGALGGRPSFFKLSSSAKTVSPAENVKFEQFHLSNSDAVCGGFFDGSVVTPSEAASCVLRTPIPATFFSPTHCFLGVAFSIQRYLAESQRVVCVASMRRAVAFGRSRGLPFAPEGHPASGCRSSVVCSFVERWDDAGVS